MKRRPDVPIEKFMNRKFRWHARKILEIIFFFQILVISRVTLRVSRQTPPNIYAYTVGIHIFHMQAEKSILENALNLLCMHREKVHNCSKLEEQSQESGY